MLRSFLLILLLPSLALCQSTADRLDRLDAFLRTPIRRPAAPTPVPVIDPWDILIGPGMADLTTYTPIRHPNFPADLRQSGGTRGVHGWYSQMFRTNGERGDDGKWPEGTIFADVLRNEDGIVFEHREAHRMDYGWDRFIVYTNRAAWPEGYAGLKRRDCASCHDSGPFDSIFSAK